MMLVQQHTSMGDLPPLVNFENHREFSSLNTTSQPTSAIFQTSLEVNLRAANINDVEAVAQLGRTVYSATFGHTIPAADLKAYLADAYTTDAIRKDIIDCHKHFVVAFSNVDSRIIGFAQLTEGTTDPCLEDLSSPIELQRLYVSHDCHGMGIGKAMIEWCENRAKNLGYKTLWLGVWEGNFKAQKLYERMGYERLGDHEFKMGRCIQIDWIMCKSI